MTNLDRFDGALKKAAVVLGLAGGAAFTGLYPVWIGVIASFIGVLCGALATSPVFSGAASNGWNRLLQALAAIFTAAAGSSQLDAVQKFLTPVHPVFAAKIGLGVMLGAQVFAFLAQRGSAAGQPGVVAFVLVGFLAFNASGCATLGPIVQACKDCVDEQGPQDLRDLEQNAGPFVEHAFMCDPTFSGAALPPCLVKALAGVVVAMGPDGVRFRDCVIAKVEANKDGKQPALAVKRAKLAKARLAVGMPL